MKNPSQVSDYYERLGLEKNASKEEIRHAYRKLTKKYHPDMNLGNEKASKLEFDVIRQAYEV
jgi:DnaJ-class molecular chaperone